MATVNILDASNHYYDNSISTLTAVNTQDAIDEIKLTVEQGAVTSILDLNITDGTSGQLLTTNGAGTFTFEDAPIALPDQTGFGGFVLTTDGTNASWTNDVTFTGATVHTNSGTNPFVISRADGNDEYIEVYLDDSNARFAYTNDETSGTILYSITNTDLESGGGASANSGTIKYQQDTTGTALRINDKEIVKLDTSNNVFFDVAPDLVGEGMLKWNFTETKIEAESGLYSTGDIKTTSSFIGNLTGNASTASAFETSRTISLTGGVTGTSAAWDGSSNLSFATTIASVTRSDTSNSATPAAGATFDVIDSVTTNSAGQVTAVNVKTVTMPALTIYDVNDVVIANV